MGAGASNGCSMQQGGFFAASGATIGFTAGNGIATRDTILARDDANTLALRNGAAAQTFRVYNTTDGTNSEFGSVKWTSNRLEIATEKVGTGTARDLGLMPSMANAGAVQGQRLYIGSSGAHFYEQYGYLYLLGGANGIAFASNVNMEGSVQISGLLKFAGTSSSFPAIKRSTTFLQARLADDSDFAGFASANMQAATAYTVATLPGTPGTGMIARVTDATAPTIGTTVVGGGAAYALVNYNGANWTVIGV